MKLSVTMMNLESEGKEKPEPYRCPTQSDYYCSSGTAWAPGQKPVGGFRSVISFGNSGDARMSPVSNPKGKKVF